MSVELVGRCDACDVQYAKEYAKEYASEYASESIDLLRISHDIEDARARHALTCPGKVTFVAVVCDRSVLDLLHKN